MTVTVTSPAANKRLCRLADLKRELDLIGDITYDKLLFDMITQASDYIVRYTGREFAKETISETLPARGGFKLVLTRTPIVSITQILKSGIVVDSSTYSIDDAEAGILFRKSGWTDTSFTESFITAWPSSEGRRDWQVDYVAGYVLPEDPSGSSNLPGDIQRACILLAKTWFLDRKSNPDIQSVRIGDAEETRFSRSSGIPPTVQKLLDPWKRVYI